MQQSSVLSKRHLSERLNAPVSAFSLVFGILCGSRALTHQPFFLAKLLLKIGHTALVIHLKIITQLCFQFSVFSNKQYLNRYLVF